MIGKYLIKAIALVTITTSIFAFKSIGVSAVWKEDDTSAVCTDTSNGNFVNSDDVYTNVITASEARQLILSEDGDYISKITDNYTRLSIDYREYTAENMPGSNGWSVPKEPCYEFYVHAYDDKGEIIYDVCEYLVGKESRIVYIAPNQGGMSLYQIKNNKKVKTFNYSGKGVSYEWR